LKVTLLLADHAEVADGKLFINGGGWTITGPDPCPYSIALYIEVPWDQANTKHTFQLDLLDSDGQAITFETPDGVEPISAEGEFEVARPLGVKAGTPIPVPLALNLTPPPPVPPGGRYEWRLTINGKTDEDWRLTFSTRPAGSQAMAA
jgi:hypothetical protein